MSLTIEPELRQEQPRYTLPVATLPATPFPKKVVAT
jgi:hypothetical protein